MNQNKPPVAPQGTVEGEADPDLEKGWLPKVLHRASLEMVIIRWVQDKATDEQLRELRDKLAAARESVAPPSVAMQHADRPTVEEILEEWADGRAYGENSHFIKVFSRTALDYITQLKASSMAVSGEGSEVPALSYSDRCEYCGTLECDHKHGNGHRCCGDCCALHGMLTTYEHGEYEFVRRIVDYKNELITELEALKKAALSSPLQPTFAYELAMYLTRNSQLGNAPEMQGEIEQFLRDKGSSPLPNEYEAGFNRCKELAEAIVDEHDGYLCQIGYLDPITSRILFPVSSPLQEGAAPPDTRHD